MMDDLNALLEEAKKIPVKNDGEFERLPDGTYKAIVNKVEFKESKSGNLMFVWEFIITEGEYTKQHEWKYNVLNNAENMQRLITDLSKFGVNTKSIESIENDLDVIIDVPVTLDIVSKPSKNNPETIYRNLSVKPLK